MFTEITEEIKSHLKKDERVFQSKITNGSCRQNRQLIRFIKGQWKLSMNVNWVEVEIPLEEYSAMAMIEGRTGHTIETRVIRSWDKR